MNNLSRTIIDNINDELFRSTMNPVAHVSKGANMSKSDITSIVLVGGSSRIPRIQQLLYDFFNSKQPCCGVDPDEKLLLVQQFKQPILKKIHLKQLEIFFFSMLHHFHLV